MKKNCHIFLQSNASNVGKMLLILINPLGAYCRIVNISSKVMSRDFVLSKTVIQVTGWGMLWVVLNFDLQLRLFLAILHHTGAHCLLPKQTCFFSMWSVHQLRGGLGGGGGACDFPTTSFQNQNAKI